MSISPVKFATAFERLRGQLGAIQSESARLQLLMRFWPEIKAVKGNQTFSGFVEEYNGLLAKALTAAAITDLDADGLAQLESQIADLTAVEIGADKMAAVKMGRARLLLYLGETEAGVAAAAEAANVKYEPAEQSAAGRHRSEFERFEQAYNALPETELKRQLQPILEDWQSRREAVHHDRAVCVFVAKGTAEGNSDGRLRVLRARVEPASKAAPGDQVTFDNQIRTPQDPFVGSAYAALAAVRGYLAESGYSGRAKSHLNAHFTVEDSGETFTGDSIGLAIALLTYTQLLQLEVERQDRFLSAEVAYTGAVSPEGEILPVSDESIGAKVKRVFHSPVRFLVLPQANYPAARSALDELEAAYPRRNLTLIPVRHLADCLNDHNVVRSQKVCIGEYVARRAAKYSRMTAVQVAMLGVVGYLLLAVISPKNFWPWFDTRIAEVKISGAQFKALNTNGNVLFVSRVYSDALAGGVLRSDNQSGVESCYPCDPDDDGDDELVFMATSKSNSLRSLDFYESDGTRMWSKDLFRLTSYPGDVADDNVAANCSYSPLGFYPFLSLNSGLCFLTMSVASNPFRCQLLLFNTRGEVIGGPYIHTGQFSGAELQLDINGDGQLEFIRGGTNNRMQRAVVVVIDITHVGGVSPPWDNELFIKSGLERGQQLRYVSFPGTRLTSGKGVKNWVVNIQVDSLSQARYRVGVKEGDGLTACAVTLSYSERPEALPGIIYLLDSNFIPIRAEFSDHDFDLLNATLLGIGAEPYASADSLASQLTREVQVYFGNTLVHQASAGLSFYGGTEP